MVAIPFVGVEMNNVAAWTGIIFSGVYAAIIAAKITVFLWNVMIRGIVLLTGKVFSNSTHGMAKVEA
jgi:hypothetical protein